MKRALAIGCGGTIGGAWIVAALHALKEQTGWDPREASVLQGTSAGAEIVTMLGGGASVDDLVASEGGVRAPGLAGLGANFMLRGRRRAAFESAMTTAPSTVRRAWES